MSLFTYSSQKSLAVETPPFSIKVLNPLDPLYEASFYYQTNDDIIIYDVVRLVNVDQTRSVTINLEEKIQGKNGWLAFAQNPVTLAPNSVQDIIFSVTIPDNVCEGIYTGILNGTLTDYTGFSSSSGMTANISIGTEMIFDIQSGYICPIPEDLPGLTENPIFIPPPSVVATVLQSTPVSGSGGGGGGPSYIPLIPLEELPEEIVDIINDPTNPFNELETFNELGEEPATTIPEATEENNTNELETPIPPPESTPEATIPTDNGGNTLNDLGDIILTPIEELIDRLIEPQIPEAPVEEIIEPVPVDLLITAFPEKRLKNDFSTRGKLILYDKADLTPKYIYQIPLNTSGKNNIDDLSIAAGTYHASFKGLSHITVFIPNIEVTIETDFLNLDFSQSGQPFLLAGDNQYKFDDFINSLDLATTTGVMMTNNELADFNLDGMVNALDYAIQLFNLYKKGDQLINQPI